MTPVRLANPRRQIEVLRDSAGVPHVRGRSWLDALYGLGYMHGTDRPTQMHFGRSVALGRAAERIANMGNGGRGTDNALDFQFLVGWSL